jgi:hypothetical protein
MTNFLFCDDGRVADEKERDGDEVANSIDDASAYAKSGVQLSSSGWEDHVLVIIETGW